MKRRAAFLDRDGTFNKRPAPHEYVSTPDEFTWLPGAAAGASRLQNAGYTLIIVSNQRGLARGMVTMTVLHEIEGLIQQQLAQYGCRVESFKYCPHEITDRCNCRKPKPGLLTSAASQLGLELSSSWMIGDSLSDVQAGRAAGCHTALIASHDHEGMADITDGTLESISWQILRRDEAHAA